MIASGRTLAFTMVNQCLVYVSATCAPSDTDWDEYLAYLRANFNAHEKVKALVVERGRGLTQAQRQRLDEATAQLQLTVAVISDSTVTRFVLNAISWVKRGYKAFSSAQFDEALRYLDVPHAGSRIKEEMRKLTAELDGHRNAVDSR
ncbi:MAG TPA: hypothetical protein VK524_00205 [Polyangiaceae bacterium]|nr:hypothetical protein [Polyangiaceae bacterium]